MMVVVRYIAEEEVRTEMLDLVPLEGNFGAANCTKAIISAVDKAGLRRAKCVSDFSDSCNVMRGCRNGVGKQLRDTPGFQDMLDVGGCTLHTISNANRAAVLEVFPNLPDLLDDVFITFQRSEKRTYEFQQLQKQLGFNSHKFQRYVEMRWLILLPCLERVDEQWEVLIAYVNNNEQQLSSFRGNRLINSLRAPDTRIHIRFLIYALKLSGKFEKLFQSSSVLIHKLHKELVLLLQTISAQFVKPEFLSGNVSVWEVDFKDSSVYLPLSKILIGYNTEHLIGNNEVGLLRLKFRSFYIKLASFLSKKLPFKNDVIPYLSFLGMPLDVSVDHVVCVSKKIPNILPPEQLDELQTEVRLFNLRDRTILNCDVPDPVSAWLSLSSSTDSSDFSHLSRVALACCTIFHGNSDAEREISKDHDLDDFEKRNCLSDFTRRNLLLCRSFLKSRHLTSAQVEISKELVDMGYQASSEYKKALDNKKKKADEEEANRRAKEEEERMRLIAKKDSERRSELKKIQDREADAKKILQEAQKDAVEAERRLQKAMTNLKEAHQKQEQASKSVASCDLEREKVESKALEKAAATVMRQASQLKRQAESDRVKSLPKISKKK